MEIHLAHTQGFCAGVSNAIEVVNQALQKYGTPLYVRHHIVHNTSVIREFEKQGVVFIEDLDQVPSGSIVIFSAHGTAPAVYKKAEERHVTAIDATCPLVKKVHKEAIFYSKKDIQTILIGHRGHQELVGTSGYVNPDLLHIVENESDIEALDLDPSKPTAYLTQTTLSVSDTEELISKLKIKYPDIQAPPKSDICFATQNRQDAVIKLTEKCDVIIICGSPHSSNSNRLKETAEKQNVRSYIIDTADELQVEWLQNVSCVGVSSGASVPRYIVDGVVDKIQEHYPSSTLFQEDSIEKNIRFSLPKI